MHVGSHFDVTNMCAASGLKSATLKTKSEWLNLLTKTSKKKRLHTGSTTLRNKLSLLSFTDVQPTRFGWMLAVAVNPKAAAVNGILALRSVAFWFINAAAQLAAKETNLVWARSNRSQLATDSATGEQSKDESSCVKLLHGLVIYGITPFAFGVWNTRYQIHKSSLPLHMANEELLDWHCSRCPRWKKLFRELG